LGADEFLAQLRAEGFDPTVLQGIAVFAYTVEVGSLAGSEIDLGLAVPGDFPLTPPPGPHVSPRLGHPSGAVHASPLGADWEYWSRPHPSWPQTSQTVAAYMRHIRTLFAQR
jgi:hypothetical protein